MIRGGEEVLIWEVRGGEEVLIWEVLMILQRNVIHLRT